MRRTGKFLTALALDGGKHRVIAFVGGGGKTGLIWQLTDELVQAGKKVIVTTTTHMAFEPERPFAKDGDTAEIRRMLEAHGYVLAASVDRQKNKLAAPVLQEKKKMPDISGGIDEAMKNLREMCDVLLIEADGARKMPLKIPREREPVIPDCTDTVVGVIGLDCLLGTVRDKAYNPEEAAAFLEKSKDRPVEPEDIVKIALSPSGLKKGVGEREYRVYLNKADVLGRDALEQVRGILTCFFERKTVSAVGSLRQKCIFNNLCGGTELSGPQAKLAMIVLAAGNSRRFGSNKLLYEIDGQPMYMHILEKLLHVKNQLRRAEDFDMDIRTEISVVTQYAEIGNQAEANGIRVIYNPAPEKGISHSLQIGLKANEDADACLFTVADQPWILTDTICRLAEVFFKSKKGIACVSYKGIPGNPCIFSKKYYNELLALKGDKGGKGIILAHPEDTLFLEIENAQELEDMDTIKK